MSSSSSDSGGFLDINPQQHGNSFSDIYKKLLTMVESFDPLNAITPAPSLPDISNYTIAPPPLPPPSDLGTAKSRKDATAPGLEKEMEEFLQLDFIDWNVTESGKFESGTTTKKESNQIPATVPVVEPQVQRALTDSELPAQPELIVKPSTPVPPRTLPRLEMPKTFLPVEPEHLPSQSSLPVTQPKPVPPSTPVVPPKSPKLQPQPPKSPQPQCIQCNKRVSAFFFVDRCQHKLCEECVKEYIHTFICHIQPGFCQNTAEPEIPCPNPRCTGALAYAVIKSNTSDQEFQKYDEWLRDWSLSRTPQTRWCPKCKCAIIGDPQVPKMTCNNCKTVFCFNCKRPWHEGKCKM